jgi:BirA family biotin operon repressor/biotin-[acetyl-CoA-carboxylase] ligase
MSPDSITALSLAAGVAVIRTLKTIGIGDAGLKWPNDIYWQDRKLGGILIEVRGQAGGTCDVVIGIGLNVSLSETQASQIGQPSADIETALGSPVSRNELLTHLINQLFAVLHSYQLNGFSELIDEWRASDIVRERQIRMTSASGDVVGYARDVDLNGALLLSVDGHLKRFLSGEVSLRDANE